MSDAGNSFALSVVAHDRVVEGLAGECHLVLGRGQLFLQRQHVLVGFQVGITLGQGEQPAQRPRDLPLRRAETRHRRRVARARGRLLLGGHRLVPRTNHRIERLALMAHVALGDFDEIGDQVVSPLELHVDLAEGILVPVPQGHERVECSDRIQDEHDHDHAAPEESRGHGGKREDWRHVVTPRVGNRPDLTDRDEASEQLSCISRMTLCCLSTASPKSCGTLTPACMGHDTAQQHGPRQPQQSDEPWRRPKNQKNLKIHERSSNRYVPLFLLITSPLTLLRSAIAGTAGIDEKLGPDSSIFTKKTSKWHVSESGARRSRQNRGGGYPHAEMGCRLNCVEMLAWRSRL